MPLYNPPKIGEVINVLRQHSRMYQTYTVAGETSRSWLLVPGENNWLLKSIAENPVENLKHCTKLSKKGQRPNFVGHEGDDLWIMGDKRDVEINKWVVEHAWRVRERVGLISTPDEITVAIARLVHYDVPDFEV